MKYRCFALAVVSIVSGWLPGLAQPADDRVAPEPSPPPPGVHETRPRGLARFLESLSPETRKRFEAAREKALQDPKLQELRQAAAEANKNFFRAIRDKMLEIDPGLADIVKGLAGERKGWKRWREERFPSGFGNLSEEELDKFISAREKAKSDPAVQTADKMRRDANTPEQRNAASEDYRNAMLQAMVKADPSIESLLEKIAAKPSPPPANAANPEPSGEKGGPISR